MLDSSRPSSSLSEGLPVVSQNLAQSSGVPPLVINDPFVTLELINPWSSEQDANDFENRTTPFAMSFLKPEVSPFRVPDASQCLDCERSVSNVVPPASEVSLTQDLVPLSSQSQEEFLNLDALPVPGPETLTLSGPDSLDLLQVSNRVPGITKRSPPTSPLTTFVDPDDSSAPDLPSLLESSVLSSSHL